MKDAPLLSEFWKTFILLQNATAGAAVFLWNTNFWHCVDETEASEVHKSLETKQQSQEDCSYFFILWYDLISLERLKFLINLLLALLTAKGTSLKCFSMKISGMSYKSTHVRSLRTFNRAPSFSLSGAETELANLIWKPSIPWGFHCMEMRGAADLRVLEHYLQYYRFSSRSYLMSIFTFTSASLDIQNKDRHKDMKITATGCAFIN